MACSCSKRKGLKYVWTNGTDTVVYASELQAKAKVIRVGGSYTAKE